MHLPLRQAEHLRIAQKFSGKIQHMRRIGSGKEGGENGSARQIPLNFLHVRIEADGQHAVGFVEDQRLEVVKGKGAAQKMIEYAAGSAHQHLNTRTQGVQLTAVAHAAVDGANSKPRAFKQDPRFALNLSGKLARGRQDQCLYSFVFRVKSVEQREQIGSCFTAARAGLNHDVASGHEIGQRVRLYRHEPRPGSAGAGLPHDGGKIGKRKGRERVFGRCDIEFFFRGSAGHGILHSHYIIYGGYGKRPLEVLPPAGIRR